MSDTTSTTETKTVEYDPKAVREWARAEGLKVGDRGRISTEVVDAYRAAHPGA